VFVDDHERERPGELIHVDIKKLGNIPDGGGRRIAARAQGRRNSRATTRPTTRPCTSETQRRTALDPRLHLYHHHRGHAVLGNQPLASRVTNLSGQNI
jgi:hypothetical protein